jgi:hypothetical protein
MEGKISAIVLWGKNKKRGKCIGRQEKMKSKKVKYAI